MCSIGPEMMLFVRPAIPPARYVCGKDKFWFV